MKTQARVRSKKTPRRLPPGQKLLLATCFVAMIGWVISSISHPTRNEAQQLTPPPAEAVGVATVAATQMPCRLQQPMDDLAARINVLANQPKLHTGVFIVEPETGKYVDVDGRRAYSAASMIKLPVLVALLQAVDAGTVKMDQTVVVRPDLKGGGSGSLQWRPDNTTLSLNECAQLMMIISDNTATNMIIDLLGGKIKCNQQFAQWGLTQTRINNWLPDLPGTNTTSPYDLALLLSKVDAGQLVSNDSRSWLFKTLERNHIRTLLPQGLPPGCRIADKTGDIGSLVGDAGIITTVGGKRYIAAVAVERPHNDRRANELIRKISKEAYVAVTGDAEAIRKLEAQQAAWKPSPRHSRRHHRRHHG